MNRVRPAAVALLMFASLVRAGAKLTPEEVREWREDIRHFAAEAPKTHKDLYHALAPEQFETRVKQLEERVPELTREQVIVELARIVAAIGDGHTYVILWSPEVAFHTLPVRLYVFKDGVYVLAAKSEHSAIVGGRVTHIGARGIDDAVAAVTELVSRDNESGAREFVPVFLSTPEILEALAIAESSEHVPITVIKEGREVRADLPAAPGAEARRISWDALPDWVDARTTTPLWLRHPSDNFWNEYLPESKTMYVQYNAVYPIDGLMPGTFFQRVIQEAEQKQADRLVVDVRLNGGGNNGFNLPIIHALLRSDRFDRRGRLFTLIGRKTFSAAQNFVNLMQIHTETLFVGEPTGGKPNHFGDNSPVVLPNSHIEIRLSTLWWQDMDPRDQRLWRAPDIAASLSFEDYRQGRDPVLESALRYGLTPGIAERVRDAVLKSDLDTARLALREFKADPANEFVTAESPLNDLGYALLNEHDLDSAIVVLRLNVEEFPQSANAWDSLGEACMAQGNRDEAIANYEKSLELNPRNGNARAMIRRLKGQSH